MNEDRRGLIWRWVLLTAVFAGLIAYLIIFLQEPRQEKPFVAKEFAPHETKAPARKPPDAANENKRVPAGPVLEEPSLKASLPEDPCARIEKDVSDFFRYLDSRKYVKAMDLSAGTYARFKHILRALVARTPMPAGEGIDPKIIIRNVYHFFRVLERKDLQLIREVMANEYDSLEINIELFYRWLTLGKQCPDPEGLRPQKETLYHYAGFFLNTTGGRACLFRRAQGLRLLVSYYSLLILHSADQEGINSYGIDILPFIKTLKGEIHLYPDFLFKDDYIEGLNRIQGYYLQRRK